MDNSKISSASLADSVRWVLATLLFSFLLSSVPSIAVAQKNDSPPGKLPSAERIVGDYVKAIGGKKRLAAIADTTYEWSVKLKEQTMGVAQTQIKAPVSVRTTMIFGNGIIDAAANTSSAWERGLDGKVRTLDTLRTPGKPLLLRFSDPDCGPCAALLPEIGCCWQLERAATVTICGDAKPPPTT